MQVSVSKKCNCEFDSAQKDTNDHCVNSIDFDDISTSRLVDLIPQTTNIYQKGKRVFDILIAAILLLLCFPLMVLVTIAIKFTSRGPVFFSQERAGYLGKTFKMYKFRSMKQGAEDDRQYLKHLNELDWPVFKIFNDPRLTLVGKLIRKSSIDELPQLFNVLRGEMSIVGPRPLWIHEANKTKGKARLRACVKPGLTCFWQISGRSELSYERWVELDLYYIQTRNFLLDFQILIQTLPAVLTGRGAY